MGETSWALKNCRVLGFNSAEGRGGLECDAYFAPGDTNVWTRPRSQGWRTKTERSLIT